MREFFQTGEGEKGVNGLYVGFILMDVSESSD